MFSPMPSVPLIPSREALDRYDAEMRAWCADQERVTLHLFAIPAMVLGLALVCIAIGIGLSVN